MPQISKRAIDQLPVNIFYHTRICLCMAVPFSQHEVSV